MLMFSPFTSWQLYVGDINTPHSSHILRALLPSSFFPHGRTYYTEWGSFCLIDLSRFTAELTGLHLGQLWLRGSFKLWYLLKHLQVIKSLGANPLWRVLWQTANPHMYARADVYKGIVAIEKCKAFLVSSLITMWRSCFRYMKMLPHIPGRGKGSTFFGLNN